MMYLIGVLFTTPCPGDYKPTIRGKFRPKLSPKVYVDLEQYKGLWYQMYRVNGTTKDWGDCSTAKYSRYYDVNNYITDPYSLNITNTVFPKDLQDGKSGNRHNISAFTKKIGNLNQPDAPFYNSGDLTVKLFDLIPAASYQVLDTDY